MPNKIFLGPLRDMWKTVADWVSGTSNDEPKVDVSDRAARKLGEVTLTGHTVVDVSDRANRLLGKVSMDGVATENTLGAVKAVLEDLLNPHVHVATKKNITVSPASQVDLFSTKSVEAMVDIYVAVSSDAKHEFEILVEWFNPSPSPGVSSNFDFDIVQFDERFKVSSRMQVKSTTAKVWITNKSPASRVYDVLLGGFR